MLQYVKILGIYLVFMVEYVVVDRVFCAAKYFMNLLFSFFRYIMIVVLCYKKIPLF